MPLPAIYSMAKRAGWSVAKAERAWGKIKDAVVGAEIKGGSTIPANFDKWTSEMWAYVMGSLRNAMKLKPSVESMIESVLRGTHPSEVLRKHLSDPSLNFRGVSSTIGTFYHKGESIKTFFDGSGVLRFSTEDDVLINPSSDYRLLELMEYADVMSVDSPLFDLFERYEGSLDSLYRRVTDEYSLISEIGI